MKNYKQIEKLLSEIDIDVSLEHESLDTIDELSEFLEENDYFNVEIIYYSRAIEYLQEHDMSLTDSLQLAHDMGYEAKDLNSEILASILASQNVRQDYETIMPEISELLEN